MFLLILNSTNYKLIKIVYFYQIECFKQPLQNYTKEFKVIEIVHVISFNGVACSFSFGKFQYPKVVS
jgi:hypothetical protein